MDNSLVKTIPLNGPVKFSPDGKHLLVFEETNVAVYETSTGRQKGNLPDIPKKYSALESEPLFSFSPQGTYVTYAKKLCHIWNLKTVQKHLADITISVENSSTFSGQIVWNSSETRFTSVPRSGNQHNISRLYDAQTGEMVKEINHTRYSSAPAHVSINDDGSLVAFIIPSSARILNDSAHGLLIYNLSDGSIFRVGSADNVQQVVFCPDNIHALITYNGNRVSVYNKENTRLWPWPQFVCASGVHSRTSDGKLCTNRLRMHMNGSQTTVKNERDRREHYIITQDGNTFTATYHTKPYTKEKTLLGNTHSLALIKKNRKVPFLGGVAHYDLFLKLLKTLEQREVQLLEQVPIFSNGIRFAGSHDEHLLITDPIKDLLYIFSLPAGQQIGALKFHEIRISPDSHSFVLGDQGGKRTWYILPRAIDMLSKENDSYFSLLPADIRAYVQNKKTA